MHASGAEAARKVAALGGAAVVAGLWKLALYVSKLVVVALPGSVAVGARRASLTNLTVAIDPSPLMIAVGALGSVRSGLSMALGAGVSWLALGPWAIEAGAAEAGPADAAVAWFAPLVKWLLWPGVGMMVAASLTSVALSWRSIVRTFQGGRAGDGEAASTLGPPDAAPSLSDIPWRAFGIVALVVGLGTIVAQRVLFGIAWWAGALAVALTVVLAAVAGRVTGEAGITPIGAMGKVTQLVFGALVPGQPAANLMSANVTGGAAAQCADLLVDLKTGAILRASPRNQAIAQMAGVVGGAGAASLAYLVLVPDPRAQLGTTEWPAPAVATWKAVAEVFAQGLGSMPPHALRAMAIGALAGIVLAVLERHAPERIRPYVPSPAAMGLGFVVQAWYAIAIAGGALLGAAVRRAAPAWSERMLVPILSGVVAGESLMGVAIAVRSILGA
jgi:uncharacterized oligopeptide transporter (OPT) family protein